MKEQDLVIGIKGYVEKPDLNDGVERGTYVDIQEDDAFVLVLPELWNKMQARILELDPDAPVCGVVHAIPKTAVYRGKLGVMQLPPSDKHGVIPDGNIPVPPGEGALFWIRTDEKGDDIND
jgi:hypothetical protein